MVEEFERRGEEIQRLVGHTRRKYFKGVASVDLEEMEAEGVYWVYENAWRYDPEKSSFTTFVCMTARSGMSMYLRSEVKRLRRSIDFDEIAEVYGYEQGFEMEESGVRELLEGFACNYKGLKREIAYGLISGVNKRDIAKAKGVSRQYVSKVMGDIASACREKYEMVDGVIKERGIEK